MSERTKTASHPAPDPTTPRKGRPGLPKGTADRVRELIEGLLEREPFKGRGGITRLAERLKISQPAITMIRQGGGVSQETGLEVALLAGVDPMELLGGAYVGVAIGGRHPNLEVCLAYHVSNPNRWSPATIAAVRAQLWPDEVSPDEWARRLDAVEKGLASVKAHEAPVAPGGSGGGGQGRPPIVRRPAG